MPYFHVRKLGPGNFSATKIDDGCFTLSTEVPGAFIMNNMPMPMNELRIVGRGCSEDSYFIHIAELNQKELSDAEQYASSALLREQIEPTRGIMDIKQAEALFKEKLKEYETLTKTKEGRDIVNRHKLAHGRAKLEHPSMPASVSHVAVHADIIPSETSPSPKPKKPLPTVVNISGDSLTDANDGKANSLLDFFMRPLSEEEITALPKEQQQASLYQLKDSFAEMGWRAAMMVDLHNSSKNTPLSREQIFSITYGGDEHGNVSKENPIHISVDPKANKIQLTFDSQFIQSVTDEGKPENPHRNAFIAALKAASNQRMFRMNGEPTGCLAAMSNMAQVAGFLHELAKRNSDSAQDVRAVADYLTGLIKDPANAPWLQTPEAKKYLQESFQKFDFVKDNLKLAEAVEGVLTPNRPTKPRTSEIEKNEGQIAQPVAAAVTPQFKKAVGAQLSGTPSTPSVKPSPGESAQLEGETPPKTPPIPQAIKKMKND